MIRVDGLVKYYGSHRAVSNLNFSVEANQVVGLLGLNGAGKTTILRILAGDLEASAGSIYVGDQAINKDPIAHRKQVGFLPERVPLYPQMTVREYLEFLGRLRGVTASELGARVLSCCERVGIRDHLDTQLGALSHGYGKRLGIASTLVHNPKLIILDEPISGLDPKQIIGMRALVQDLSRDHTVILSSHILREISRTCDQILVIREGEIAAAGTEDELSKRFTSGQRLRLTLRGEESLVRDFLSSRPELSSFEILEVEGETLTAELESEDDIAEALVVEIVKAGFGLRALQSPSDALETTFMELTAEPDQNHHEEEEL